MQESAPGESADDLRRRAEEALGKSSQQIEQLPVKDLQLLVYELQVHQIELKMQNQELRETQLQLEASKDSYTELYEFAPVGYLTLDVQGSIQTANLTASILIGLERSELIGTKLSQHVAPEDQDALHRLVSHMKANGTRSCDLRVRQLEQLVWTSVQGRVRASDPKSWLVTLTDIRHRKFAEEELRETNRTLEERTEELHSVNRELEHALSELRQSERKLVQNERLSAMGEMASGVSHNLNNMLTPAAVLIDVALMDPNLSEATRHVLQLVKSSAEDATELVKQLGSLYGSKGLKEEKEHLDLNELMREIPLLTSAKWQSGPRKSGVEISIDLQLGRVPSIHGNASDLRQVLTNLIFNAVDALPSGGVIGLRLFQDEDTVVAEVTDNGEGMSPIEQAKCFEPFFTTKHTGSGLGLATCASVIERHSGSITVNSKIGHGTTFRIELPVPTQSATSGVRSAVTIDANRHKPLRILYIDDAPSVRKAMLALYDSFGHQVDVAEDGPKGLVAFQENDYDIVVSDFTMPGMNGREVASAVKAIRPDTIVVLVTGWPIEEVKPAPNEDTKEDYLLEKPFNIAALNKVIEGMAR